MQCDKHVVKMTLETTQLLSTALHKHGVSGPYKMTHENHPCTIWAATNRENFIWLGKHGLALCKEYTKRYGKIHKCQDIIEGNVICFNGVLPEGKMTDFVQAMPEQYRQVDPVEAYRAYYKGEKSRFAKWKNVEKPEWMK